MKVTEITDYSIVIMKDSEDKPWMSLREIKEKLDEFPFANFILMNLDDNNLSYRIYHNKDFDLVCDSRVLVLLMKGNTKETVNAINLKVGNNIGVMAFGKFYGGIK